MTKKHNNSMNDRNIEDKKEIHEDQDHELSKINTDKDFFINFICNTCIICLSIMDSFSLFGISIIY